MGYQVRDAAAGQTDERHQRDHAASDAARHARHLPTDVRNVVKGRVPTALTDDRHRARVLVQYRIIATTERGQEHFQRVLTTVVSHRAFQPIRHEKAETGQQSPAQG